MINWAEPGADLDRLLEKVSDSEEAKHVLGLFLEETVDQLESDLPDALLRALEQLPVSGPLRRRKDRVVVRAVCSLLREISITDTRLARILKLLDDASARVA